MKVLFLTSWYPDRFSIFGGIFVRDQAVAISRLAQTAVVAPRAPLEWLRGWGKPEPLGPVAGLLEVRPQLPPWGIKKMKSRAIVSTMLSAARGLRKRWGIPDVIHAHVTSPAGEAGAILKQQWGCPLVITEHAGPFDSLVHKFGKEHVLRTLNAADSIVAVSPFQKSQMENAGVNGSISVIGNIVTGPQEPILKTPRKPGDVVRLLSVGVPSKLKGTGELLGAMGILVRKGYDKLRLRIAGGGKENEWLHHIKNEGLHGAVEFCGAVPHNQLPVEYVACDALIHTSRYESFCMVIAEALSFGKPVITTPCGGPEWFVNNTNGIVAADMSARAIAEAIEEWYDVRMRFQPMAIAEALRERFSAEVIGGQLMELYETVKVND